MAEVEIPAPQWAFDGDVSVAYQTFGDGPIDVVVVPGVGAQLELFWDLPRARPWLTALAETARLIMFDKRGSGLSQRLPGYPPLEERAGDIDAVLGASGSQRAVLMGVSEGGTLAAYYAATQPERVAGLIVWGGFARKSRASDYPHGAPADKQLAFVREFVVPNWGQVFEGNSPCPSLWDNEAWQQAWAKMTRASITPTEVMRTWELLMDMDVRAVLSAIDCPSLIAQRKGDVVTDVGHARYLAEHIPGAELVLFDGADHLPFTDANALEVRETIREFLIHCGGATQSTGSDRTLATVVFTDIVGSTEAAARLGDHEWARLLDEHDRASRGVVRDFGGEVIKTTGDGALALFEAPAKAVRAAQSLAGSLAALGLEIRAGVHFGEVEHRGTDVTGMAVHVASRVEGAAAPGSVVVTSTVRDLVPGSGLEFEPLGTFDLKGIDRPWDLYRAT